MECMEYMAVIGGDFGSTYTGTALEVAAWAAAWSGGRDKWVDVYRCEADPVLVYVGGTLAVGHRPTTCKTDAVPDPVWIEAMAEVADRVDYGFDGMNANESNGGMALCL